jgi:hypothetical protein
MLELLEQVWEKLKQWSRELLETLLGPEGEPDCETIPVRADDEAARRQRR